MTKIHKWKFTKGPQAQPFNSTVNSQKKASSGHVLYQAVVAGEEVTLAISKVGKDFTYYLQLQTHW
jgi:hypothetical protein